MRRKSNLTKILVSHKDTVFAKDGDVNLTFDDFEIPFSFETVKKYSEQVLDELYAKSGLPKIPVHFARGTGGNAIAVFQYYIYKDQSGNVTDYKPSDFTFHLDKLEKYGFSPRQLRGVIIHEFGHYMRLCIFGPNAINDTTQGHDSLWEECVKKLGGDPSRYHTPHHTRLFASKPGPKPEPKTVVYPKVRNINLKPTVGKTTITSKVPTTISKTKIIKK